jgi:DNA repair exonuclease SbcCD ATPase subunit
LSQAEDIQAGKDRIAELEQQLAEAQVMPPTKSIVIPNSDFEFICCYLLIGASSSLATASSEHENLHSAYQDLETKLAEAETKRERAEKQLAEKKSKLLQKEADFVMKRKVDNDTLQVLQKEVQGPQNYMTNAEQCWDLLNANVMGKKPNLKNQINPLDSN